MQSIGFAQTKENIDTLQIPELPGTIPDIHDLFSFVYTENDRLKNEIETFKKSEKKLREDLSEQKNRFDMLEKKYNNFPDKKSMEARIAELSEIENKHRDTIATIRADFEALKNDQPSLLLLEYNKGKDAALKELEVFLKNKSTDEIINSMTYPISSFYRSLLGTKISGDTKTKLNILQIYFSVEEKLKTKCNQEDFDKMDQDLRGLSVDSQNVKDLLEVLGDRKSMTEDVIFMLEEIQVINKNTVANDVNTARIKRSKLYERLEFFCYNHDYLNEKWPYLNNYLREVRKRISESENTGYNVDVSDIILELKK